MLDVLCKLQLVFDARRGVRIPDDLLMCMVPGLVRVFAMRAKPCID